MNKEELTKLLNSEEFMQNLKIFAAKFKSNKGYGRWLAEYQRMDKQGLFTAKSLKEQYIKILKDISPLQYLYWEAIHYIGSQALDATKEYFDNCYCDIRAITGEIAEDENGEELIYLEVSEAKALCAQMNKELGENIFVVYDSQSGKPIAI